MEFGMKCSFHLVFPQVTFIQKINGFCYVTSNPGIRVSRDAAINLIKTAKCEFNYWIFIYFIYIYKNDSNIINSNEKPNQTLIHPLVKERMFLRSS